DPQHALRLSDRLGRRHRRGPGPGTARRRRRGAGRQRGGRRHRHHHGRRRQHDHHLQHRRRRRRHDLPLAGAPPRSRAQRPGQRQPLGRVPGAGDRPARPRGVASGRRRQRRGGLHPAAPL
ncbi:MAG: hypothetical protein AVDCRST_MAG64-2647, partial [uncultured Phycisphaerae bacterium]